MKKKKKKTHAFSVCFCFDKSIYRDINQKIGKKKMVAHGLGNHVYESFRVCLVGMKMVRKNN